MLVSLLVLAACGGSKAANVGPVTTTGSSVGTTLAPPETTAGPVDTTTAPTPLVTPAPTVDPTTIPKVTVTVVGTVVGGNSGGIGEGNTDTYSDTVMIDSDGDDDLTEADTCSGWGDPERNGQWTGALREGAKVQVLDADSGQVRGTGTLGVGRPRNLDPDGDQWQCSFSLSIAGVEPAKAYRIKVEGLEPWAAAPDPAKPGAVIATVLLASPKLIEQCQSPDLPDELFEWPEVVGRYWSVGLPSLCENGLRIANLRRRCHPPTLAPGAILQVADAADPKVVYEDTSGVKVDGSTLAPGTPVLVTLASAVGC